MIKRWHEPLYETYLERILHCLTKGKTIGEDLSPFGLYENRIDFRGLELPVCSTIKKCRFLHVDMSYSSIESVNAEKCLFEDVIFDSANMQGFRDLGNKYLNCSFIRTDLSGAGIGHYGSYYNQCVFKNTKFKRTRFIRTEYDNCLFEDCKLKNADFNASSFVSCKFIGKLHGVCFSNGYFMGKELNKEFGVPRVNRMQNVSFAEAELKEVSFRYNCNLSTIIMPKSGEYRLYDKFRKRMELLQSKINEFEGEDRKQVEIFTKVYLIDAVDLEQEEYIFNCDELRQYYGNSLGERILHILDEIQ